MAQIWVSKKYDNNIWDYVEKNQSFGGQSFWSTAIQMQKTKSTTINGFFWFWW